MSDSTLRRRRRRRRAVRPDHRRPAGPRRRTRPARREASRAVDLPQGDRPAPPDHGDPAQLGPGGRGAHVGRSRPSWRWPSGPVLSAPGQVDLAGPADRSRAGRAQPVPDGAVFPQDRLEALLLADLQAHGAEVRFDTELVDLHADGSEVRVDLRGHGARTTSTAAARYLVGADGSRSTVRDRLGIAGRAAGCGGPPPQHAVPGRPVGGDAGGAVRADRDGGARGRGDVRDDRSGRLGGSTTWSGTRRPARPGRLARRADGRADPGRLRAARTWSWRCRACSPGTSAPAVARAAAVRAGVPGRRCRAPDHAARRDRDEHRDRRRPQPRLEAGLGDPRLGRRGGCWTPTRPSGRRSVGPTPRRRWCTGMGADGAHAVIQDFGVRYVSGAVLGGHA